MARPTQQEIDEWEARMNEPEGPDPDDFEVVLFDENGSPVGTMPYAKAKAYFKKRGIDFDESPAGSPVAGNAGASANPAGASGSPVSSNARSTRATARYFGKAGSGTPVGDPGDPTNAGQQPV
jgi:hypothetical protein